jgi:thioredoxin reductase
MANLFVNPANSGDGGPMTQKTYDVLVVGGGPAGLAGAVALGRARRSVLVVDAGEPRNAPADGIHNFLTRDGTTPAEFAATGRAEVRRFGGEIVDGRATAASRTDDGFAVALADGTSVTARRLLVTTGLVDELPDVPGVRERWGRDVLHCPYCHGWEVRDTAIGVLGGSPMSGHQALMWTQWSDDVTLFRHTMDAPDADTAEQLAARGVTVVTGEVAALVVENDRLTGVRLADGTVVARDAVVVAPRFVGRTDLLVSLGLEVIEHPLGIGSFVPGDPTGLTAVPGVWVAGNVAELMAQVVTSAGAGLMAGTAINADLLQAETAAAVDARRGARLLVAQTSLP